MKLTTFLLARTIENWAKLMLDSKRTFKIKVTSRWTVFRILLMSQLFAFKEFCIEKRLFNILKTTKVTKLTEAILKSSYRVLQESPCFISCMISEETYFSGYILFTLQRPVLLSYRNQLINLHSKSIDWFLFARYYISLMDVAQNLTFITSYYIYFKLLIILFSF